MDKYFEITNQYKILNNSINKDNDKKIKDINTETVYILAGDVKIIPIGTYESEIFYKNRRELLNVFYKILPFTANRLLQITYYKLPDYKELYKNNKKYSSAKEYERVHRYGDLRTMKGSFIIDSFSFKERDGYLIMKDIEDNNIEKAIIVRNLVSFTFGNIKYYINE